MLRARKLPPNVHTGVGSIARPVRALRRRPTFNSVGTVGPTRGGLKQPPRPAAVAPPRPAAPAPAAAPPNVAAPMTAEGQTLRANADLSLSGAKNAYRDQVYRAAMQLGDQSVLDKLKKDPQFAGYKFAIDPNSQFS